jgi:hypothetical protein
MAGRLQPTCGLSADFLALSGRLVGNRCYGDLFPPILGRAAPFALAKAFGFITKTAPLQTGLSHCIAKSENLRPHFGHCATLRRSMLESYPFFGPAVARYLTTGSGDPGKCEHREKKWQSMGTYSWVPGTPYHAQT